jgi:nicotinamide riboside transporter PnuC
MALGTTQVLSIEKRRFKAFICKIFGIWCLTYAQKQKTTLTILACCKAAKYATNQNRKSLI